jgi:hypothetical protein
MISEYFTPLDMLALSTSDGEGTRLIGAKSGTPTGQVCCSGNVPFAHPGSGQKVEVLKAERRLGGSPSALEWRAPRAAPMRAFQVCTEM